MEEHSELNTLHRIIAANQNFPNLITDIEYALQYDAKNSNSAVDDFLAAFLRFRKGHAEEAATMILEYWEFRSGILGMGGRRPLSKETQRALSSAFAAAPPGATDLEGRPILLFWSARVRPDEHGPLEIVRAFWLVLERMISNTAVQTQGLCFLDNTENAGMINGDKTMVKLIGQHLQHRMPIRLGCAYILGPPTIFYVLWPIIKLLLKGKLSERIVVFGGGGWGVQVVGSVGKRVVPREWGGELEFNEKRWIENEFGIIDL